MAIRFETITSKPQAVVRTRSDVAPSDCGMAAPLPKIATELPKITENFGNEGMSKKRGRPRKADALTPAEKQRRYRERKRAAAS